MNVTISTREHKCTGPQDCGEEIIERGDGWQLVRNYVINDGQTPPPVFKTREKAVKMAERLGYTVIE